MTTVLPPPPDGAREGTRDPSDSEATEASSAQEETIRLEAELFRRRRRKTRLRRLRPWLLGLVGVALVAGGVWLVGFSPYLRAERVSVSGIQVLRAAQVQSAAAVPNQPLARVDLDQIRARVAKLAPVKSVEVSRSWPHTVKIAIIERTPVAVLQRGSAFVAMDATGLPFRTYAARPPRLPLIAAAASADRAARKEAARVLGSLSAPLLSRVAQLEVTSIDGITLAMRNGQRVVWGTAADSEVKAEVLDILIKQPNVKVIDVSVPGRPTTRR